MASVTISGSIMSVPGHFEHLIRFTALFTLLSVHGSASGVASIISSTSSCGGGSASSVKRPPFSRFSPVQGISFFITNAGHDPLGRYHFIVYLIYCSFRIFLCFVFCVCLPAFLFSFVPSQRIFSSLYSLLIFICLLQLRFPFLLIFSSRSVDFFLSLS